MPLLCYTANISFILLQRTGGQTGAIKLPKCFDAWLMKTMTVNKWQWPALRHYVTTRLLGCKGVLFAGQWSIRGLSHATSQSVTSADSFVYNNVSKEMQTSNNRIKGNNGTQSYYCNVIRGRCESTMTSVSTAATMFRQQTQFPLLSVLQAAQFLTL
jgi:hypothetical protein